jgi:hypothetical protein
MKCGARRVWESSRRTLDVCIDLDPCANSSISVTAEETGSWQGLGDLSSPTAGVRTGSACSRRCSSGFRMVGGVVTYR